MSIAQLDLNMHVHQGPSMPAERQRKLCATFSVSGHLHLKNVRSLSLENDEEDLLALSTAAELLHMQNGIASNPSRKQDSSVSGRSFPSICRRRLFAFLLYRRLCNAISDFWASSHGSRKTTVLASVFQPIREQ
ncbi:uncharacterized protein BT62DRAFT_939190 [Guyanagaster necrorhizus]|uniref:Uncharacterized protein n=1 Tax=Guyanagaster necrorhizus TaxID=856835 RepID=A0A9P7VE35_9AGAR|nr:uncharacterized protein BT62DRAFT_939190 [Guyanagaster necrorhizus MCA 3950]KAG7439213.1 hypothetical protein BT62DRAFT_939190 [Guyanagaster necrorhizus MCA 3950]